MKSAVKATSSPVARRFIDVRRRARSLSSITTGVVLVRDPPPLVALGLARLGQHSHHKLRRPPPMEPAARLHCGRMTEGGGDGLPAPAAGEAARGGAAGGGSGERRPGGRLSAAAVRGLARLHRLAEAGWAATAVGVWALLQASVVPGPVDVVLIPLGLADPRRAWHFAWSAVLGSIVGALVAYVVGAAAFDSVGQVILGWLGVSDADFAQSRALFTDKGLWIVFLGTVTPLSIKLVSIGAGAVGLPIVPFAATILVGRGLRFSVIAVAVRYFGDGVERYVKRRYGRTVDDLAREEDS
jgi:membrane protein YqaA with SNARE-associated domain